MQQRTSFICPYFPFNRIMVFPMPCVIKWLYGANRGHDGRVMRYGKTGTGFYREPPSRVVSCETKFF